MHPSKASVSEAASSMSPLTTSTASDQSYRLACQTKLENHGEVVVMVSTVSRNRTEPVSDEAELRKKFGALPLGKKLATLMQLEVITMSQAFDSAIEKPLAFGSKTFGAFLDRTRAKAASAKPKK